MDNIHEFQRSEDVMDEAYAWVLKFNGDAPVSHDDIAAMREWASRSPVHRRALKEAEEFWCEAELLSALAVPMQKKQRGGLRGFFSGLVAAFSLSGGAASAAWGRSAALVSFAFLSLAITLAWQLAPLFNSVGNGVYRTAVGEQITLPLRDGSQLLLDTGSEVRIAYEEAHRAIYLVRGKAHFDVAKDPDRPFEVYARDGLVRAVGTAFSVYLAEENIEVLVDEGKVDLARVLELEAKGAREDSARAGQVSSVNAIKVASRSVVGEVFLSLEVGQAANFDDKQQVFIQLSQKELQNAQAWRDGTLVFVRDPLSDVVYEVSRYTDVTIEITDPELGGLVMGGRFKVGDLDALLEVLEIGFGVKVVYLNERHVRLSLASDE